MFEKSFGISVQYTICESVKSATKFVIVYFTVYLWLPYLLIPQHNSTPFEILFIPHLFALLSNVPDVVQLDNVSYFVPLSDTDKPFISDFPKL